MWQRKQPMREKRAEESCEIWSFSGSPSELSSRSHISDRHWIPQWRPPKGVWKLRKAERWDFLPFLQWGRGALLAEVYPIEGFSPTILPHDKTSDEPQIVLSIPPHTTRAYRWGLTRRPFVGARLHQGICQTQGRSFNRLLQQKLATHTPKWFYLIADFRSTGSKWKLHTLLLPGHLWPANFECSAWCAKYCGWVRTCREALPFSWRCETIIPLPIHPVGQGSPTL